MLAQAGKLGHWMAGGGSVEVGSGGGGVEGKGGGGRGVS